MILDFSERRSNQSNHKAPFHNDNNRQNEDTISTHIFYSEVINNNDNSSYNDNSTYNDNLICFNCKGHKIEESVHENNQDDIDFIIYTSILRKDIKIRHKFRNFSLSGDPDKRIILCSNCN